MGRKYTENETVVALSNALKEKEKLYAARCINWTGLCRDTRRPYTEIIAEQLLCRDIQAMFAGLTIERKQPYFVQHDGRSNEESNRYEEHLAKRLVREGKTLGTLGKFIDYQIPLKNRKVVSEGKIDLVSVSEGAVYCIELKACGNKETLLRAALEIETYYHQLSKEKFLNELQWKYPDGALINKKNIRKAVLLVEGCQAYIDAKQMSGSQLESLLKKMGIRVSLMKTAVVLEEEKL